MNAPHCRTCTCDGSAPSYRMGDKSPLGPPNFGPPYCDASVQRLHEYFVCLEKEGHEGPHRSTLVYGKEGCASCGGLDEHATSCSLIGEMVDTSDPLHEVTWKNDGEVELISWFGLEEP